jgi:hypothetical protein
MMAGGYPMIQQQPQPLLKPDVPLRKLDVDSIERAIEAAAATDENEEVEATQSAGADEAR